jgi:type IV pilus assembly protein PilM
MKTSRVKKCLGIDLGTANVKIAEVEIEGPATRVLNLLEHPRDTLYESSEGVARQIRLMLKKAGIATRSAVFCLSGNSTFRGLKLPCAIEDQLDRMIRFEASQRIPFSPDKTVLAYQVFKLQPEKNGVRVLLVAAKSELVVEMQKLIRQTGLRSRGLTSSPLALHNFFRLNNKQMKAQDGILSVLANIGASSTEIIIPSFDPNVSGFTRSILLGGQQIDQAIKKKLLISLNDAEAYKRTVVTVSADAFSEEDPEASAAATAVIDRIVSEIRRTFDFYNSQPDGVAVDKLFLSGGSSNLRGLSQYLQQSLGMPVSLVKFDRAFFQFSNRCQMSDSDLTKFPIAIGLAMQGVGRTPITIDLS